ncbi:DUF134 domain-containing protein [Chloroflexota bacterium]
MARPRKFRRIAFTPEVTYFKPAGIPLRRLEEVCLSMEEAEAIRLKDLEGLEQEQCAEKMHISRPTFHRVIGSARRKVAEALLKGKAIRIEGGDFEMAVCGFRCLEAHERDEPFCRPSLPDSAEAEGIGAGSEEDAPCKRILMKCPKCPYEDNK